MEIRNYQTADYVEIAELFHGSVHGIDTAVYSQQQLDAWSPTPIDYDHWKQRLDQKKPFIAVQDDTILGFIELEDDGHIDCLYVHKDHQRQGVAQQLYRHLYLAAKSKGINKLYVEASELAKPFFEFHGFETISENTVTMKNHQTIINYNMVGIL